ncbi:hypothetical protein G6644_08660 [Polynucleobacter paneuropaeus]|nr:hypothetical protein [Polynucleobacter paneuropaeus]MBT8638567.1 hypothetical protein [Polynucleobacter paneuropaeus]
MKILVAGDCGYIGLCPVIQPFNAEKQALILNNLCNRKEMVIDCIEKITGKRPIFVGGDVGNHALLGQILRKLCHANG